MLSLADVMKVLPTPLDELFSGATSRNLEAIQAVQRFESWFKVSGVPFFRTYTDHSEAHSFEVFASGPELISEDSRHTISATDVSFFLVSCYAHDCALHITDKQFQQLVSVEDDVITPALDSRSWRLLWTEYLREASHFSQQQLLNIFGDTQAVRSPPAEAIEYSNRDRLLIGEFIRRHHPRLAHDMVNGLDKRLGLSDLLSGFDQLERDAIGLIARSHGLPLRTTISYLEQYIDIRDFRGAHLVFLMVMLRIADLAQIQSARAPRIAQEIHSINSPLSAREWRVHRSIKNINHTHTDPEAIFIDCRPERVGDLVRARDWISSLQSELDLSWAVLGEVYGRHAEIGRLAIKLRRVRSTLTESKRQNLGFVPEAFGFRVAEAEMLSLLLGPLYGDHPLYGVRELIQNARDATVESQALSAGAAPRAQIGLSLDGATDPPTVTVRDAGIGMDIEVIRSYFLTAGASFRSSSEWKRSFVDKDGAATVARGGRFGVGALAAFLIGPKIKVTTRRQDAKDGIGLTFTCSLQDQEIEIRSVAAPVGTEIMVFAEMDKFRKLSGSLSLLSRLFRFLDIDLKVELSEPKQAPRSISTAPAKEVRVSTIEFSTEEFSTVEVGLTRSGFSANNSGVEAYVNGIAIASVGTTLGFSREVLEDVDVTRPVVLPGRLRESSFSGHFNYLIAIEDRGAAARINLARTQMSGPHLGISTRIHAEVNRLFLEEFASRTGHWLRGEPDDRIQLFSISQRNAIAFAGRFIPNDYFVIKAEGIQQLCRINVSVRDLMSLSVARPRVGFIVGGPPSLKTDVINYLRDMKHRAGAGAAAVFLSEQSDLLDVVTGAGVSDWMRREVLSVKAALDGYRIIGFGSPSAAGRELVLDVGRATGRPVVEIFENASAEYEWVSWLGKKGDSIVGRRWGKT